MIDKLIEIGISVTDMAELKPYLKLENTSDFLQNITLLESIGCNSEILENIIVGNPTFLERSFKDILALVTYLKSLGFNGLNVLFDSYPEFLNKDAWEIKSYIEKRLQNGEELSLVKEEIDNNPSIIDMI